MNSRTLNDIFEAQEESTRRTSTTFAPNILRIMFWNKIGWFAAAILIISSCLACFVLSGKVIDLKNQLEQAQSQAKQDVAAAEPDSSAIINLYLREHQDIVARHASVSPAGSIPAQILVNQDDILYYEFLDDEPKYMSPGIIVRGPSSEQDIDSASAPIISNGHTLTLSEARETTDFELHAPARLFPGYSLDEIRRIDGRDALQLLYTDGINSVSLFEQPLDGQRGLEAKDFREYAVYQNSGQAGGTILAWRDGELSYVLISNIEMSHLMEIAQFISAGK
jgi:hypothetical protein